jgi:hypothetical protein
MSVPFLYSLYPVTPTLSVEADQVSFISVVEIGVPNRFCGIEGGVVSPVGGGGGGGGKVDGGGGIVEGGGGVYVVPGL